MTHSVPLFTNQKQSWSPLAESGIAPEIQLWRIALDEPVAEVNCLSVDEHERAKQFRFPVHRHRFIAGRIALRMLLADELRCHPARIQFEYSRYGKPSIPDMHFNLAHSDNTGLLAIAPFPVGVDVERIRPVEFEMLARTVFAQAEMEAWEKLPAAERPNAFYRLWTRKEAVLKGIGCGITEHVKNVSVFFDNAAGPSETSGLDVSSWRIHSFQFPPSIQAAVAWTAT